MIPYPTSFGVFSRGSQVSEMSFFTIVGVRLAVFWRIIAASPATCGVAMEVPLNVPKPPPSTDDLMLTPGAETSGLVKRIGEAALNRPLPGPMLEKEARTFALSTAPTVITLRAAPGCRMAKGGRAPA